MRKDKYVQIEYGTKFCIPELSEKELKELHNETQVDMAKYVQNTIENDMKAYLDHLRKNYPDVNVAPEIVGDIIEGEYQVINEPKRLEHN